MQYAACVIESSSKSLHFAQNIVGLHPIVLEQKLRKGLGSYQRALQVEVIMAELLPFVECGH